MLKALKVSRLRNANVILFVNISNFLKWDKYMHYDIKRSPLGYFEIIVLHFSMLEANITEHTNGKYHVFTF